MDISKWQNLICIWSAVRKTLKFTKLQKLAMFRSCIDNLIKNLELYPQDEADIFYTLYIIGRLHGKFVVRIIQEVSQELEPSLDGKLEFNKVRTAALFVLAISAPVSFELKICSIPPQIFSYAVTLLGRISSGLVDVVDQNSLLAYLSQCSRFTFTSLPENLEGGLMDFCLNYNLIHPFKTSDEVSSLLPKTMEPKKVRTPQSHVKVMSCVETVFQEIVNLWPLIQLGSMNEVAQTLRSWKEELRKFSRDPHQSPGLLVFALKYIHIIKLLGNAWACSFSKIGLQMKGMGAFENLLGKFERRLKDMLYRYVGLSRGVKLHILELMLVAYTLRLLYGEACCFGDYMSKLNFVLRSIENLHKEGSVEISHFVTELQKVSCGIGHSDDEDDDKLDLIQNSLNLFFLKHIELSGDLKYLDAEVDVCDNDFQNPLPFIPGLPVGIPLEITLYNISSETKLWLEISIGEKPTQFIFLDLNEFGGSDAIRKFEYVAPLFSTPRVKHFLVKVSIALECLYEYQHIKPRNKPKRELIYLSKGKEVHFFHGS